MTNDYFPFLERYMGDYYTSQNIADINDLERAMEEDVLDTDTFLYMRNEVHRLTMECFEKALTNYLHERFGAPKL